METASRHLAKEALCLHFLKKRVFNPDFWNISIFPDHRLLDFGPVYLHSDLPKLNKLTILFLLVIICPSRKSQKKHNPYKKGLIFLSFEFYKLKFNWQKCGNQYKSLGSYSTCKNKMADLPLLFLLTAKPTDLHFNHHLQTHCDS